MFENEVQLIFNKVYNNLRYLYYICMKFHKNWLTRLDVIEAQTNKLLSYFYIIFQDDHKFNINFNSIYFY